MAYWGHLWSLCFCRCCWRFCTNSSADSRCFRDSQPPEASVLEQFSSHQPLVAFCHTLCMIAIWWHSYCPRLCRLACWAIAVRGCRYTVARMLVISNCCQRLFWPNCRQADTQTRRKMLAYQRLAELHYNCWPRLTRSTLMAEMVGSTEKRASSKSL